MELKTFTNYLNQLEQTSKRLEITAILKELITEIESDQIDKAAYLSLGTLNATFKDEKFNIAEKMMLRALESAYNTPQDEVSVQFSKEGDLGMVARYLALKQNTSESAKNQLNILELHDKLEKIAKLEGSGSQDAKITKTAELLRSVDEDSAKFITRIVLGTMRLGFTEITIIDALTDYIDQISELNLTKDSRKELKKQLEDIYYTHPDIGLICKKVKENGLEGVKDIKIETGVPILAQKAQRLPSFEEIIEKMGTIWAEYKFDGTRVQLHLDRNKEAEITELEQKSLFDDTLFGSESQDPDKRMLIKTYTRNLEETTYQYPDIVEAADKQIKAASVILDGEAIGFDPETKEFLPFQQIMQRKRKHNVKEMAEKVPLKYFVFDILFLNGESLTERPLRERKEILKSIIEVGNKNTDVIVIDEYPELNNVEELKAYFEDAREKGLEGLILKKPDAPYQAGARSYTWVKLKVADTKLLDDSVDVVVLGYYMGRGVRSEFGIGGFLAGIYDPEEGIFKSITKVGTGLSDKQWVLLKTKADLVATAGNTQPKDVVIDKMYTPDVWIEPTLVVELGADEISVSQTHSLGYALRFPRLIKFRDDKKATDSTTPEEIKQMHDMQKAGSY